MTDNFLFTTIILSLVLIASDVAFYFWRRNRHADGKSLRLSALAVLERARIWLGKQQAHLSKFQPITATRGRIEPAPPTPLFETSSAQDSVTIAPALVANREAVISTALPLQTEFPENKHSAQRSAPAPENISVSTGAKSVHFQFSADVPEGTRVTVTLEVLDGQGKSFSQITTLGHAELPQQFSTRSGELSQALPAQPARKSRQIFPTHLGNNLKQFFGKAGRGIFSRAVQWNARIENLDRALLLTAIVIYALVISLGIDHYPIYFFTDEAIHMNLASDFLRDGLKNYSGEFLPTFFITEGWVNGTSVYLQVLPFIIFGKSVVVTRLVSAFISLLGALAAALLLRDGFKFKYYWAGIFLVLTTPAWFLHARTAFEYVEVGSFYSIFLYFYTRYRAGQLRSLYWAVIAGALTFYTHGLGQILMAVTGLTLFVVDFRYHMHPERRKTVLGALLLAGILLLPFLRYYLGHPGEAAAQVKRRGSYWVNDNLSFVGKVGSFVGQYAQGLTPMYWYFPNKVDLNRHIMDSYGNGLLATLPLVVVGLFQSIKNIRKPAYRIVMIALLACPFPASVVAIGMPRMLWMTLPLALLGMIGLVSILDWVEGRWRVPTNWISTGLFIILAGLSVFMLSDALVHGPTWFKDYSLYGMQYGAKQVFQDVVRAGLEKDPNRSYVISPSWANGTEQFVAFFIPEKLQPRVSMGQPIDFIDVLKKKPTNFYFVATSDEYDKLIQNTEFQNIKVEQTLPFPNGKPGFYIISLDVADNIEQIIAAEKELQRKPVEDGISLNGQDIRIIHSPLGAGQIKDIFDNDPDSLARVQLANPFLIDLYPTTPLNTSSVTIQTGSLPDFTVTISLYAADSSTPVIYTQTFKDNPPDPLVNMFFDKGPAASGRITIEIKDNSSGDSSQIHVRTIQFK